MSEFSYPSYYASLRATASQAGTVTLRFTELTLKHKGEAKNNEM